MATTSRARWRARRARDGWMPPLRDWQRCRVPSFNRDALLGQSCQAGLCCSTRPKDLVALVLWFPAQQALLPTFWVPAVTVQCAVPQPWEFARDVETMPGLQLHPERLAVAIGTVLRQYQLCGPLRMNASSGRVLARLLRQQGVSVSCRLWACATLMAAKRRLVRAVTAQQVQHAGNKVLRLMLQNARRARRAPHSSAALRNTDGWRAVIYAMIASTPTGVVACQSP